MERQTEAAMIYTVCYRNFSGSLNMFVLKTPIIYELQLKRYQIKEHICISISIMAYKLIILPDDDASFLLNHPGVGYYSARSLLQQFLGRHVCLTNILRSRYF
jgi:hypothetical protein